MTCYPSLLDLPEKVDLAVLAVADERIEETPGAWPSRRKSAPPASSAVASSTRRPRSRLADRLSAMAREASLPVNGGNCMGYCNYEAGIRVNSFRSPTASRAP